MHKSNNNKIPQWLSYSEKVNATSPVWFIDVQGTDFTPESPLWQEKINLEILALLGEMEKPEPLKEPVLIKCHIGEKKCRTRMRPEFCLSTVEYFRLRGMKNIVSGDTTVAYTGDRGYHDNHGSNTYRYHTLAEKHGWTEKGPLKTPFVILDRPHTAIKGFFSFHDEEIMLKPDTSKRFNEVYLSGGFAAASTIVNHVHLTLHDMAQVACAVKGLTMGGSSYKGKLIMHKCYSPSINEDKCKKCGTCSMKCPENALSWKKGAVPELDGSVCIGCGECVAVCHGKSITMTSSEIEDWLKGGDSLPYRMADYLIGMIEGRWNRLVNIVHLYNITRRCDCVNEAQKPIAPHIGFLIGKNPFAVDLMANNLLNEVLHEYGENTIENSVLFEKDRALQRFFDTYHGIEPYRHIQQEYGIVVEPELIHIKLN